jgi:flagellar FliL protein
MAQTKVKEPEEEIEEKDTDASPSEGEGEGGEAGAEGKKSKKKIIILGVVGLLLLLAAGGGAFYMGVFEKKEEHSNVELGADGKPIEKAIFYTLPEFLVNLNTGGKQSSFLKATVILEVPHQGDVPQIEANLPRLLDTLNTYLRELRPSDLSGSAGIQRLREELLLRSNKTMAPIKINDILFKEIIVQ